jgi:PTH1 family peptidyl-tRNA hydrolase
VGLGNPGPEYAWTPHNIGFLVAEALAERWDLGRARRRYAGLLHEGRAGWIQPDGADLAAIPRPGPRVALLLPQTFMNEAGRAVGPARGAYRLPLERVLVVHDEIDLPFGELRTRLGGGLAGHNGLKSLKRELGGVDFWRARVGVGRPDSTDPEVVAGYVLGRYRQSPEEVRELVGRACAEVERVLVEQGRDSGREGGDE